MKRLITVLLIFLPAFLAAQHDSYWEARKLVLGVIFSPNLSGPSFSVDESFSGNGRYREEAKSAFSFGLQARYKINDKWEAQLRMLRADKGYKHIFVGPVTISDKSLYNYRLFYLSFPTSIRYNFNEGKFVSFYVFAGVVPDVFLRSSGLRYEEEFYPVALSYLGGIGGEFPLRDHWFLNIEPIFMQALTVFNRFRQYRPLSAGLAIGFFYDYQPEFADSGR